MHGRDVLVPFGSDDQAARAAFRALQNWNVSDVVYVGASRQPLFLVALGALLVLSAMALVITVREGRNRQIRKIDVMQIRDRYFLLNVSVGLSAGIMKEAKREEINKLGVFAFLRQALKRKSNLPAYRFQVTIDGTVISMRATELFIANSGTLLGLKALQLDPKADLDTGRLSVCYARLRSLLDYVRIGLKLVAAPSEENKDLNCKDALREVRIHSNQPVPVQGDGEQVGTTPVTISLVPRALNIVVPREQA
jgi:diacylglycerol kinase family enzyme